MGKIKIYEIAKKLNLASKEVVEMAGKLNIEVKNHMSAVSEEDAEKIANKFNSKTEKEAKKREKTNKVEEESKKEKKTTKTEPKNSKKEEKAPVIIRREVLIEEKGKEEVKKQNKTNNVGFVERKQNKDFNIVYRNKPNKPLTVSELFGLSKETKKEEPKKVEEQPKQEVDNKELKAEETNKKEITAEKQIKEMPKEENKKEEKNIKEQGEVNQPMQKMQTKQVVQENKQERNQGNYQNRNNYNRNNYRNGQERNNQDRNNNQNRNWQDRNNRDNRDNGFRDRRNNGNNINNNRFRNNNGNNGDNRFNNRNNNNNRPYQKRPLDEKGIEKNIKNIMSAEVGEKENVREYNKNIDKQKNNNKYDENRTNKKSKGRRNNQQSGFDEGKLKSLKQTSKLSHMFNDQEGGMLDYYDLTTERGRKGKKKAPKANEERNKQKIFKLTEIEIPESITVKDLAAEMKKTTAEVIKKLLGYGIMATINNEIDFDTAFLVAGEFGITA